MDKFKIENFTKDKPEGSFPECRSLSREEAFVLRRALGRKMNIPESASTLNFTKEIRKKCCVINGVNSKDERFKLQRFLREIRVNPLTVIYINWYRYDDIDEIRVDDLADHFLDIWYPSSDDIEIFDATFSWIVGVSHDGVIEVWKE